MATPMGFEPMKTFRLGGGRSILLSYGVIFSMVGKTGLEPATSCSRSRRTPKLCYFPKSRTLIEYIYSIAYNTHLVNLIRCIF